MPTPTYVSLATITVSAVSSVTFSSIPATYRDLVIVGDFIGSGNALVNVNFNNDTGNRTRVGMFGDSSGGSPGSFTASNIVLGAALTATRNAAILQIMDYSATDKHTTTLLRSNNAGISDVSAQAGRWASTAAVNEIDLVPASGNLTGSFSLYGIAA
jgi:hypothetical protein